MKGNLKSARDTNAITNDRESQKCARYEDNNPMKENPKSVQETIVIIE